MKKVLRFTRTSTAKKQGKGEASNQNFSIQKRRMIVGKTTYAVVRGIDNGATFAIQMTEEGKIDLRTPFRLVPVFFTKQNSPSDPETGYYIDMHRSKTCLHVEEFEIIEIED